MTALPPPHVEHELSYPEAVSALQRAFDAILSRPSMPLRLKALNVRRDGNRIVLIVTFWKFDFPPIRISRAVAESLRLKLNRVLA